MKSILLLFSFSVVLFAGCSTLLSTRPDQLMSDTAAAIKAAKEVNADTLSPDLFRQAQESFLKAKNDYTLKNYAVAEDHAKYAKKMAEDAEFESLNAGANRVSLAAPEETVKTPEAYPYPTPTPTFIAPDLNKKE